MKKKTVKIAFVMREDFKKTVQKIERGGKNTPSKD